MRTRFKAHLLQSDLEGRQGVQIAPSHCTVAKGTNILLFTEIPSHLCLPPASTAVKRFRSQLYAYLPFSQHRWRLADLSFTAVDYTYLNSNNRCRFSAVGIKWYKIGKGWIKRKR